MATKKLQIVDNLVKQAENADTLDGQHASDFTLATDFSELQELVGDLPVSEQINAATKNLVCETVTANKVVGAVYA